MVVLDEVLNLNGKVNVFNVLELIQGLFRERNDKKGKWNKNQQDDKQAGEKGSNVAGRITVDKVIDRPEGIDQKKREDD